MVPQKNVRLDRRTPMKGAAASAALLSLSDVPGRYGWDGGYGTSFYVDPKEELIGVLMCQQLWDPSFLALHHDFWTQAYQAIED